MKKTKILSLLLCLSLFCALIVPGTRAYADNEPDSGMKISKTATANADGSYTIMLEAFATGSTVITEQKTDIPTDIVLVIDQSGSMNDPIGGYTYTAYRTGGYNSRNYHNDEYYPLRHNGGSENLWHKLNNNEYIAVSVEQKMAYTAISGWSNRKYYDNQNSLYCLVSGEYKSVAVRREGHLFSADEYWYTMDGQQILYTTGDSSIPNFGQYAPLYQSVKKYIYSYTLNGATTVIEESFGDGSSPDTQFYRRDYSSSAGDCSSMESLLSSTIPPLIANGITVTLTCILLAFFDWRLALCVFITVPIVFLIIWLSRNHQKKLFEKQVDAKLDASDQVQEYLEGMKIIKSCGLSGSHFSALDKALLAMKKIAIKVEMAVGVFMSSASMILQAGIGITIFVGAILLTQGQIELLPLLMFLLMVTRIYGPILAILANLSSLLNLNVVTSRMRAMQWLPCETAAFSRWTATISCT